MQTDWQAVVDRNPKGYVELNDTKHATYGPVEAVEMRNGNVEIKVRWAARLPLDEFGIPNGKWKIISRIPIKLISFPNEAVSFVIELTPSKGERIRFGMLNILYLDDVGKFTLEEVMAEVSST